MSCSSVQQDFCTVERVKNRRCERAKALWIKGKQIKTWDKFLGIRKGQGHKRKSKKGKSNKSGNVKWQWNPWKAYSSKWREIRHGKTEEQREGLPDPKKQKPELWDSSSYSVIVSWASSVSNYTGFLYRQCRSGGISRLSYTACKKGIEGRWDEMAIITGPYWTA